MRTIAIKAILVSAVLNVLFSCVMCKKETFFIKNCTDDTLMIDLTESDTFSAWEYWSYMSNFDTLPKKDKHSVDTFFLDTAIGCETLPDSVDGYNPLHKDTGYIYAIKLNVAKRYTMGEIRAKRLYDRRIVTRKDFDCNNTYEYRK